jgi:uncharacterized protein YjbJ (UPF0337 family)
MSIWDKAKAKAEELLGRAEQVYGESHGDAAATTAGEAHVLEAEAEEEEAAEHSHDRGTDRRRDDDGLAGAR